jgi:endonuclease/exonuclease/phosphatase family metal-dependent hydrolase
MQFSVMTYNIRLGREGDLKALGDIMAEADIVAVQEVGIDWFEGAEGNQPQLLSRHSGLGHFRFAATQTFTPRDDGGVPEARSAPTPDDRPALGVALFSRFPLGPSTRHRLPKRKDGILSTTVVTPKGPMSVLVTQLSPNPVDRALQVAAVVRHAQTQASPLLALGDFQAEADDPDMLQLGPYLRNAAGDECCPTYPAQAPEHAYDHIYVTREVEILSPALPLPLMGSEHLPVMAKLAI